MQRVLVAGATGYLGGFVVREFKKRGYFVRVLVRSSVQAESLRHVADEVVEGRVSRPDALVGVCEGMDVVFSSVGITRQKDGLTFRDVDYQGNKNLLEEAMRAGVQKFVYVSVFNGPSLDIVAAHEDFVDQLMASGIDASVLRPTGYFSDMGEVFDMAKKGRVWLIGDGTNQVNPIHGADLAVACVDAVEGREPAMDVGGPETMTWKRAAEVAFEVLDRPVKIFFVPQWVMWAVVRLLRFFNRHQGELLAFLTTMATNDVVAPAFGKCTLEAHFRALHRTEPHVGSRREVEPC